MKDRPGFAGHPTTPSNGETVSAQTFSHHAVVLRVFARWLRDEGYTAEHRLERVKTPQVPETLVEVLTPEEIKLVLESESASTTNGIRNHTMLVVALDSGMRLSEIITLERRNLDLDKGVLKAFGKGSKERLVPFGYTATKSLQRYLLHYRPEPALPQYDYVFLQRNGWPPPQGAPGTGARRGAAKNALGRLHRQPLRPPLALK